MHENTITLDLNKMPQHATVLLLKAILEAKEWAEGGDDADRDVATEFILTGRKVREHILDVWGEPSMIPNVTWVKNIMEE